MSDQMITLDECVTAYSDKYAFNPKLRLSELSVINDLRNNKLPWPNNESAGCYIFYNEAKKIIYIGVAVKIGARLNNWFVYETPTNSIPKGEWKEYPKFLQTVAVNEPHEALSLEAYLIDEFQPSENFRGIRKERNPQSAAGDLIGV